MTKKQFEKTKYPSSDEKKDDKNKHDENRNNTNHPKSKLSTEGVSQLRYDRFSATSFSNFERDLEIVAGKEFKDLFSLVLQGKISNFSFLNQDPTTLLMRTP